MAPHANASAPPPLALTHPLVVRALELLDEDKLDREWVVRNVLGGMAAGFGLRGEGSSPLLSCGMFNC